MKKPAKFEVIKAFIPYQAIWSDCNQYHVYLIYEDGKSRLEGAVRIKRYADILAQLLEEGVI